MNTTKPTLLYDGDCGFCRYCVAYFKLRTGDAVSYQALQDGTLGRPKERCLKSIQLVLPDQTFYEGAAAAYKALSFGDEKNLWWWYQSIPGFKPVSEWGYKIVSRNRPFFFRLAKYVLGDPWPVGRLKKVLSGTVISLLLLYMMIQVGGSLSKLL